MPRHRTPLGWILFVSTACSKSVLDVSYLRRDGTFDSIFHGRGLFWSHPAWCCVNVILDALAVWGAVTMVREAVVSRWRRVDG